ncbi:LuxR C-terminal-related transcriptional regulator [Kitasatospora sp. NPDC047058]|uniref:helix-turn-helix transcriptional regulator n=1 Tax=Kitasatospora sp. NPDC047058 TaxID=3155620 RepID=UPI0033E52ABA
MWTLMDSARAVRPAVMTKEERSGRPPVDRTPLIAWATGHLSEMLAQAPGEPDLTQQHTLALRHAAAGMSNAEIGQAMCLTEDTVKSHMVEVFNRLGARGRTGAFVIGLARGVIRPHDVLPAGSEPLELAATHRLLLLLIACGLSLPEVAALAEMSLDTVKSHLRVVLRRCGTTRSSHTVAVAIVLGLVQIPGLTLPVREPA